MGSTDVPACLGTSVLIGASKLSQLDDNLGAADVHLTHDDIAELDAATPLPPVYPNWFIDNLTDQPVSHTLAAGRSVNTR